MRAFRGGGWVDAEVTVGDGEMVWAFDQPGAGRIRLALVAEVEECLEAAHRIVSFITSQRAPS